jgi:hypothetical protein
LNLQTQRTTLPDENGFYHVSSGELLFKNDFVGNESNFLLQKILKLTFSQKD